MTFRRNRCLSGSVSGCSLHPYPKAPTTPVSRVNGRRGAFLDAAVRGEVARITSAQTDRNWALYLAAKALGQLVAGGALSEQDVHATLLGAAAGHLADGAYSVRQAHLTINSGLRAGAERPRRVA
jgi:hypothetical protein